MAEIERVEIILLAQPVPLIHQFAVHQRNLPGGPAESGEADAGEYTQQFAECGRGNLGGHPVCLMRFHPLPRTDEATLGPVSNGAA